MNDRTRQTLEPFDKDQRAIVLSLTTWAETEENEDLSWANMFDYAIDLVSKVEEYSRKFSRLAGPDKKRVVVAALVILLDKSNVIPLEFEATALIILETMIEKAILIEDGKLKVRGISKNPFACCFPKPKAD